MTVEIIPFKAEHLIRMEVRPEICKTELEWVLKRGMPSFYEQFPSITIMDESRIIACFGGVYLWENTAESWLRTVSDIYRYKGVLIETIHQLNDFCFNLWKLNRVQTTVQKDWLVARKFIERLGYIQEGELKYYMGDTTYIMYAKVREN